MWSGAWPVTISFGLGNSLTLSLGFSFGLYLSIIHFSLNSTLSLTWALGLGLDLSAKFGLSLCLLLRCHPVHEPQDDPRAPSRDLAPESYPRHVGPEGRGEAGPPARGLCRPPLRRPAPSLGPKPPGTQDCIQTTSSPKLMVTHAPEPHQPSTQVTTHRTRSPKVSYVAPSVTSAATSLVLEREETKLGSMLEKTERATSPHPSVQYPQQPASSKPLLG